MAAWSLNYWTTRETPWGKSFEPQNTTLRFSPGDRRLEEHGSVSWNGDSRDLEPRVVPVAGP